MGNITLKTKFVVLLVGLILASCIVNVLWSVSTQNSQTENELREKGQVLAQQMSSVWDFMSANQERLEVTAYTSDGVYQGLHCAIVGRSIGQLFTAESDYITRFVNFNPRNSSDEPDAFEAEALAAFYDDATVKEYYGRTQYDGMEVFRYLAPMNIEETCLDCHGQPKGEIDVTGFAKEGWAIGDVGGAISIVIPLDLYAQNTQSSITQNVLFSVVLLIACVVIIYLALSQLVTRPLSKIQAGVEQIQAGDLEVRLAQTETSKEMNNLIAEFNEMAHELSDIYAHLESQVEDRTAQLEQANKVLEQHRSQLEAANERLRDDNQYKTEFLAMMSHELRTPLTSIIAFAELLNSGDEPLSEKEAESRREIEINSRELLLMINDILEMSRVDAGRAKLTYEAVDVGDVVTIVMSVVKPLADQRLIDFTCTIDPDVPLITADFEKLRHVVENLVGNAVKFTDSGGMVHLSISYDHEADEVSISVIDDGIGIADKDKQRIFERFVQVDSSASRKYNGTGLGLSLAKEYTEMHGGVIAVESTPGEGSAFTVRLPVVPPAGNGSCD